MQQGNPFDQFDAMQGLAGLPPGAIQIAPADPAAAYEAPRAAAELTGQRLRNNLTQVQTQAAVAEAQMRQQEAAREAAGRPNPALLAGQRRLQHESVIEALDRARSVLSGSSAGAAGQILSRIGGTQARDLRGALNTIASRLTIDNLQALKSSSPTGASGFGSLTEREGELLRDSVASIDQFQSRDQLEASLAQIERHYRRYYALTEGQNPELPEVQKRYGIVAMPEQVDGPQASRGLTQGDTAVQDDPTLAGVNSRVRALVAQGRSAADITDYLNSVRSGLGDEMRADVQGIVNFRRQNPTVPIGRYTIDLDNQQVPLSGTRQFFNSAAQSPLGTAAINAADILSAGTLDNLAPNPAEARAGIAAVSEANPTSALLGQIGGGALAGAAPEGALARFGMQGGAGAFAARSILSDGLLGGAYGAGSTDEGGRLSGALTGAGLGVGGGVVGRGFIGGAGRAARGVTDPDVLRLRDAGVPLTPGQMSGRLRAREDRLSGYAGIGDRINARRRQGLEGFNRATYAEALAPIGGAIEGQVGEPAVEAAQSQISDAYNRALGGRSVRMDAEFAPAISNAVNDISSLPRLGEELTSSVSEIVPPYFGPGGELSGANVQPMLQELRGLRSSYAGDPMGHRAGRKIEGVENAVTGLFERQAPEVMPAYNAANRAYRGLSVASDAVADAVNTDGIFTPAQLGRAARRNQGMFGSRMSRATTDRPFFDLQRAGQRILPNKVPDSGTAGRIEQSTLLGQARGAARNLLNAPLYAEAVQPYVTAALLSRPDAARAIGDELVRRAGLGGMMFRGPAIAYTPALTQ